MKTRENHALALASQEIGLQLREMLSEPVTELLYNANNTRTENSAQVHATHKPIGGCRWHKRESLSCHSEANVGILFAIEGAPAAHVTDTCRSEEGQTLLPTGRWPFNGIDARGDVATWEFEQTK